MVSVILVDYNSIEKTIDYVFTIVEHMRNISSIHFIIIDNYNQRSSMKLIGISSGRKITRINDKTIEIYKIKDIEIIYCFAGENLGYAKGNNLGVTISEQLYNDDYYIISNNDLEFKEDIDWIKIEKIFEEDPTICVIGPSIISTYGEHLSPHFRMSKMRTLIADYILFKPYRIRDDLDYDAKSKYCFRVSGCFMFIRASYFREAGFFDPNTFMYCEEMILSERLNMLGYKTYYYNDAELIHRHAETVKKNADNRTAQIWLHDSYKYYFQTYRGAKKATILISDIVFCIYLKRVFLIRKAKGIISSIFHNRSQK